MGEMNNCPKPTRLSNWQDDLYISKGQGSWIWECILPGPPVLVAVMVLQCQAVS